MSRILSSKGQNTALSILVAAEGLLISEGYHNFALRKVATAAGLTVGNIQYYYPSKDALINAMLDNCIQRYIDKFEDIIRANEEVSAEDQFAALISEIILDLNTKRATVFFPEVWSLSNHDIQVTAFMDAMYERYRKVLIDVIAQINPALSEQQLRRLAVFITASIEGHTIFIGYNKPWRKETKNIIDIAKQSFLWLIKYGDIPC